MLTIIIFISITCNKTKFPIVNNNKLTISAQIIVLDRRFLYLIFPSLDLSTFLGSILNLVLLIIYSANINITDIKTIEIINDKKVPIFFSE